MMGTSDGGIVAVNPYPKDQSNIRNLDWLEHGKKELIMGESISAIIYRHSSVVITGSNGLVIKYADKSGQVLPPADKDMINKIKADEGITATQMDEKNIEGIVGTADGNIKYVQFSDTEQSQCVKLVSKVTPFLDEIKILKYMQDNPSVFLTSAGKDCGDIKLMTSGMLDHIYTWPQAALGPVRFVASTPKDKKNRMIGHQSGYIKIISINALKTTSIYRVLLEDGEYLTAGCYSPSGHNFALGTSFGQILIGHLKKDPMAHVTRYNMYLARVTTVSKTTENAVTSLQMTNFDPTGTLLAAFDDAKVRCWHSSVSHEVYEKKLSEQNQKKKSRKKEAYDLADLGEVQFDIIEKFDMFENPHGVDDLTEQDAENLQELYGVSIPIPISHASLTN